MGNCQWGCYQCTVWWIKACKPCYWEVHHIIPVTPCVTKAICLSGLIHLHKDNLLKSSCYVKWQHKLLLCGFITSVSHKWFSDHKKVHDVMCYTTADGITFCRPFGSTKDPSRCSTPSQQQHHHHPPPVFSLCWACHRCQQLELTHYNGRRRCCGGGSGGEGVCANCDAFPTDILSKCTAHVPPPTATAIPTVALQGETSSPVTTALPAVLP